MKEKIFAWVIFGLLVAVGVFFYIAGRPNAFDPCMRVPIPAECYDGLNDVHVRSMTGDTELDTG